MKFLKLDKKKGSGGPSIKSRYAYLIYLDDIAYLPTANEKGVRLEGDILLKEDCTMMPLYLTSSSQEFSYDILGEDDEKSYLVKFSGNHPGTELEALEFAKNMIEQPFLVLIPSCNEAEPWKLLGEITNPLIFTSSHKGGSDSSKFTFQFEQRIGSEFIYFSYGGVEVPSDDSGGVQPPSGGFDPTKWARIDASNIDDHIAAWRTKLGIGSVDTDTTQHGPITTTPNSVTIGLSALGENFAMIGGTKYIEPTTNPETPKLFTAVSPGMLKVVIIQALPDAEVFHLVEGVEGAEATDPDYDGLLVKRIIVSDSGQVVEGDLDAFQLKANEAWVNLLLNDVGATVQTVSVHHAALRFNIISSAANIKIGGFRFYASQFLYDGIEITLRNETAGDLEITTIAGIGIISIDADGLPIILKQFESISFAYHLVDGVFYAFKSGGGGASFPELGNDGDVLVKSGTNVLWSSIIKGVEFLGNAWLKLKMISFHGYTIAQKNAIGFPQEGMLIYQNQAPKGFQKYEAGSWNAIESNISNADLSNLSVRSFTQGNTFTWNTAGFNYFLKGLPSKTGNSDYNKVIVEHNTTGEVATKSIDIVSYSDLSATFSGTVIPLNKLSGAYQMTIRNYTAYTVTSLVVGGWAVIRINAPSEPTISGASKVVGFNFLAGVPMYMYVRYNGSFVEYFFTY